MIEKLIENSKAQIDDILAQLRQIINEINSLNNTYHFLYRLFPDCESNVFVANCDVNNINRYKKRLYVF